MCSNFHIKITTYYEYGDILRLCFFLAPAKKNKFLKFSTEEIQGKFKLQILMYGQGKS